MHSTGQHSTAQSCNAFVGLDSVALTAHQQINMNQMRLQMQPKPDSLPGMAIQICCNGIMCTMCGMQAQDYSRQHCTWTAW